MNYRIVRDQGPQGSPTALRLNFASQSIWPGNGRIAKSGEGAGGMEMTVFWLTGRKTGVNLMKDNATVSEQLEIGYKILAQSFCGESCSK